MEAEKEFLIALKYDDKNYHIYNNLAYIYRLNKDNTKSIKFYRKSLEINPAQPEVLILIELLGLGK